MPRHEAPEPPGVRSLWVVRSFQKRPKKLQLLRFPRVLKIYRGLCGPEDALRFKVPKSPQSSQEVVGLRKGVGFPSFLGAPGLPGSPRVPTQKAHKAHKAPKSL